MALQRRYRKAAQGHVADVWVDVGPLRYTAELYEDGECAECKAGPRPRNEEIDVLLSGTYFAALVRVAPDRSVRCTWAR
jgi:hypothetical protein